MRQFQVYITFITIVLLLGCGEMQPNGVSVVENFKVAQYMGKWYEIARIDFKYEKDLIKTTAIYVLNKNNTVNVTNRGYDIVKKKWTSASGKAKFRGRQDKGALKVSFFEPFYSGYNILALEEKDGMYEYALVGGEDTDLLWILSRSKTIPKAIEEKFIEKARRFGYEVEKLNFIRHGELS